MPNNPLDWLSRQFGGSGGGGSPAPAANPDPNNNEGQDWFKALSPREQDNIRAYWKRTQYRPVDLGGGQTAMIGQPTDQAPSPFVQDTGKGLTQWTPQNVPGPSLGGGPAYTASPYSSQYPTGSQQGKPVTKIASAADITKKINDMIGPPPEWPPVDPAQWGAPSGGPPSGPQYGGPYNPEFNMGPLPPQNAPVDMREPPLSAQSYPMWPTPPVPGTPGARLPRTAGVPGGSPFDGYIDWRNRTLDRLLRPRVHIPQIVKDYMPQLRADGGPIGYMRGGYPDVYGSSMPIRHTFDSGGENYVGGHYGDSDGRADDVNAKLSPKEYVMDAESMSMLGDGNPDAGAKKMDQMRANLRAHKGAALAKGKFSPKAKSPQEYLVGNPMGDGLRRRGRDKG